ncbi:MULTISPECIES: hypothetical protein [unclassified Bradyrhizobium]|uniref:hypothetical protein n=1 Tax=unclassified Bradyrhizobium TaxID=2631580 RepID=UPI001FFC29EA|nr:MULTISPECIES: hypothetical protein [unclassified Bradyrhizobium]
MATKDEMRSDILTRRAALGVGALALSGRRVQAQAAKPDEIKVGIATYLSGPASVFGVPARRCRRIWNLSALRGSSAHQHFFSCLPLRLN